MYRELVSPDLAIYVLQSRLLNLISTYTRQKVVHQRRPPGHVCMRQIVVLPVWKMFFWSFDTMVLSQSGAFRMSSFPLTNEFHAFRNTRNLSLLKLLLLVYYWSYSVKISPTCWLAFGHRIKLPYTRNVSVLQHNKTNDNLKCMTKTLQFVLPKPKQAISFWLSLVTFLVVW